MAHLRASRRRLALLCCFVIAVVTVTVASASGSSVWDLPAAPIPDVSTWSQDPVWQQAQVEAQAVASAQRAAVSSPSAEAQRDRSMTQFDDLSRSEAQELAQQTFPDQMTAPVDALGLPAGDHVTSYVSATAARVEDPHGKRLLLESTEPFATEDEDSGALSKVDLSLSNDAGALVPANPAVDVQLPDSAADPVTLPDSDLSVSLVEGADVAGKVEDDRVFYGEVSTDTDYITVARPQGAEVMWQLRSPQATETLSLDLGLPVGEHARLTSALTNAGDDENPAVQIVKDDNTLVDTIAAPSAADADGVPVPARYRLDGDRLYVDVAHRRQAVKYPVLVDPEVDEIWAGNDWANMGAGTSATMAGQWRFNYSEGGLGNPWFLMNNASPTGYGMAIESAPGSFLYTAGAGAWDYWSAAPNTNIAGVWFDGFYHRSEGDHLFAGIIGPSGWETVYNIQGDEDYQQSSQFPSPAPDGSSVVFGVFEDMTTTHPAPGWVAVRGVKILIGDTHPPDDVHINWAHFNGQDFGWINPDASGVTTFPWVNSATSIDFSLSVHDPGLGLQHVGVMDEANNWAGNAWHASCNGNRSGPCPPQVTYTQHIPARLGYELVHLVGIDYADSVRFGNTYRLRVDGERPKITFSGQVVDHAHDQTLGPGAGLHVAVTDGNSSSASSYQSGVRRVLVTVDGTALPVWTNQNTDATNNDYGWDYSLPVGTNGSHTVHVTAWDDAKNLPATADLTFDSSPYPTSLIYGGTNGAIDNDTERERLAMAIRDADDDDAAFATLEAGIAPADKAAFEDFFRGWDGPSAFVVTPTVGGEPLDAAVAEEASIPVPTYANSYYLGMCGDGDRFFINALKPGNYHASEIWTSERRVYTTTPHGGGATRQVRVIRVDAEITRPYRDFARIPQNVKLRWQTTEAVWPSGAQQAYNDRNVGDANTRDATRMGVYNPWYYHASIHAYVGQDIYFRARMEFNPFSWVEHYEEGDLRRWWYGDSYPERPYHWLRCSV